MYERNQARVREIDAILDELRPLFSRLSFERSQCIEITQRTAPRSEMCANQCGGTPVSGTQTPSSEGPNGVYGMFAIIPDTKERS
jgi:hypothetical protein